MSTEQKKTPDVNPIAERVGPLWERFKQGKLISYKVMALTLIVVTALGLGLYIYVNQAAAASLKWLEYGEATSVNDLEEFAKKYPGTYPAYSAQMKTAQFLLGPDGIDRLNSGSLDEAVQRRAVANIEKAREILTKLDEELGEKGDPVLKAQCYEGLYHAEKALIGITKEGRIDEFRGSIDKMVEWADKLAAAAPNTPKGTDAKKVADRFRTDRTARDELVRVQVEMYKIRPAVGLPPGHPPVPGFPGGPRPPGIPGLPGGPTPPAGAPAVGPAPPVAPGPNPPPAPGGTTTTPPAATPPGGTPPMPAPMGMPPPTPAPTGTTPAPSTPPATPPTGTPMGTPPTPPAGTTPPPAGTTPPSPPTTPPPMPPGGTPPAPPKK